MEYFIRWLTREKLNKHRINQSGKFIYFSLSYANIEKMQQTWCSSIRKEKEDREHKEIARVGLKRRKIENLWRWKEKIGETWQGRMSVNCALV